MPELKRVALSTQDVERTATFHGEVSGMREIAQIDGPERR